VSIFIHPHIVYITVASIVPLYIDVLACVAWQTDSLTVVKCNRFCTQKIIIV